MLHHTAIRADMVDVPTDKVLCSLLNERKKLKQHKQPGLNYILVKAEVSAYTSSADECGNSKGITASGQPVSRGIVAAPKNVPFGTRVMIAGKLYIVADRGGAIKVDKHGVYHFDVYVPTKKEAFQWGRKSLIIQIYR